MAQIKTLQFPNTPKGQAEKIRVLEQETSAGWRIVSETIVPGKFKGGDACCLFLICAPCAFLAGHKDDIINVTLEKNGGQQGALPPSGVRSASGFDRQKWDALVMYDKDIAAAVEQVRFLGPRWTDELAAGYLAINDKQYLQQIVDGVISRAQAEHVRQSQLRAAPASSPIDPYKYARLGETDLRRELAKLDITQLRSVAKVCGMDPHGYVDKWKRPEEITNLIVTEALKHCNELG
jgi:hypothetical protein